MPDKADTPQRMTRELILRRAAAAATLPEPQKRYAAKGLIHDRFRFTDEPVCSIDEILTIIYGDADADAYWLAWWMPSGAVSEEQQRANLIDLDAVHSATCEIQYQLIKRALTASAAGLRDRSAIEALEYLSVSPDTARFVPEGLRRIVGIACPDRRQPSRTAPAGPRAKRPRGPKPVKRDRVVAEMRSALARGIDVLEMKGIAAQATFGASIDTCRRATDVLRSETS